MTHCILYRSATTSELVDGSGLDKSRVGNQVRSRANVDCGSGAMLNGRQRYAIQSASARQSGYAPGTKRHKAKSLFEDLAPKATTWAHCSNTVTLDDWRDEID